MEQQRSTRRYDVASAVVWVVGISQGVVPLVVRGFFDRGDRLALATRLPAPWWWIASAAVVVLAAGALLGIEAAKERATPEPAPAAAAREPEPSDPAAWYDALSGLVLLVGLYNGLAPFVSRWFFGGDLFLALPLRLPAPWWWIVSLAVVALTVVLLEGIDRAKNRAAGPPGPAER